MNSLLVLLLGFVAYEAPTSAQLEELTAIRTIFDENRNKFDYGTCTFSYDRFKDCSLEDAKRRRFQYARTTTGEYLFNDQSAKYVRLFSDEILTSAVVAKGTDRSSTDLLSFRAVTDKHRTLKELHIASTKTHVQHSVMITSDMHSFYQDIMVPLELGFPEEHRRDISVTLKMIIDQIEGVGLTSLTHADREAGRKVTTINVKSGALSSSFYVDLERGCIPLMTHRVNPNGSTSTELLDDVRLVPGRGWLPFSLTYFFLGRGEHIEITSCNFTDSPRDVLQLEFSKPIVATDMDKKLTYSAQRKWDLSRLPAPSSRNATPFDTSLNAAEPAMPGEIERSGRLRYTYYILGLVAVVLILTWGRRRAPRS